MADLRKEIGRRIRLLRHERPAGRGRRVQRMTVEDLAERAGLSPDYVAKLEQGRHSPSADTLAAIAGALGVEPGALFPSPSREASAKALAVDELVSFVSNFGAAEIRYLLEVVRVVMSKRPARKARPLP